LTLPREVVDEPHGLGRPDQTVRAEIETTSDPMPTPVHLTRGWRRFALGHVDAAVAVGFAIAALIVRWPFIVRGETLLHSDEAIVGLMAQDIAEGTRFPLYFYGQRYMGALEAYVIAAVRPLSVNPIVSLRLGPAILFAVLTALEYLMLTRWFGRAGGVIGALTLLAAAPMFVQWSISARGGYIEILVWGTLFWWLYSEWFVASAPSTRRSLRQAILGALVGSGMWINPTMLAFVAPVVVHALLGRPLALARQSGGLAAMFSGLDRFFGRLALPAIVLLAVLMLNCLWAVWVEDAKVHYAVLLDLVPRAAAVAGLGLAAAVGCIWLSRHAGVVAALRQQLSAAGPFILGVLAGNAPALWYVLARTLSGEPLEDTLPLGLRPIWMADETLVYLVRGLLVLLGADPSPFLDLVRVGRAYVTVPLPATAAAGLTALNWLVLAAGIVVGVALVSAYRGELAKPLRLEAGVHSPAVFLALALAALVSLYVLSGCTVDFTSIRYLVPVWAILPGLVAAAATAGRPRWLARGAVATLLVAWSAGQMGLFAQLGPPHPLTRLAQTLKERRVGFALAEPLDAHLLSFLTQQRPRVAEYQSFWPRLAHLRDGMDPGVPVSYVVHAADVDWTADWTRPGWPGPAPPETSRFLWPSLKQTLVERPADILSREPLVDGYELWTLSRPLPERKAGDAW
jgi:hypothetical protein